MGFKYAIVRATSRTTSGNQSFTSSGFGTPIGAIVLASMATADDTATAHAAMSFGVTDTTTTRCIFAIDEDGQSTADNKCGAQSSILVVRNNSSSDTFRASFNGTVTDGIQLNFSTAQSPGIRVGVCLIGEDAAGGVNFGIDDITIPSAQSDGTDNAVSFGFAPEGAFQVGAQVLSFSATSSQVNISFGMSDGSSEYSTAFGARDNVSTSTNCLWRGQNRMLSQVSAVSEAFTGDWDAISWDSDGFDLRKDGTETNSVHSLIVAGFGGTDINTDVNSFGGSSGAGDKVVDYVGFQPNFLIGYWVNSTATSIDTTDVWGFGVGIAVDNDGTTEEMSISIASEDGQSTTDCQCKSDAKIFNATGDNGTETATTGAEATVKSWDENGFTLDATRWTSQAVRYFLAVGNPPEVGTTVLRRRREGY